MKAPHKILTVIYLMLLSLACTEEVDPGKLGLQDELLVVNSLISPEQDTLSVQVSMSRPLFGVLPEYGSDDDLVTDATVTLSDGNTTINLTYSEEHKLYMTRAIQLPIVANQTYTLQVVAGERTATAQTTVPLSVPLLDVRINTNQNFEQRVVMSWLDPGAEVNFYRVRATQQDAIGREYGTAYFEDEEFHSDVTTNGAGISARGEMYLVPEPQFNWLVGELISCDENYFLYHRNNNRFDDEDPFSEPTLTHSNIEGGTGIFGSYVTRQLSITID